MIEVTEAVGSDLAFFLGAISHFSRQIREASTLGFTPSARQSSTGSLRGNFRVATSSDFD